MPSGGRRMIWNTQERALSTDHNRAQAFNGANGAELFRYLIDVSSGTDDLDASALDTEYTTQENPLRGEIANGVLVQPQAGTLNLLVSPGVAYVLDPDASPTTDDSAYKLIRTAGVTTLGVLTITGNASGFTRIDVIECQRVENNVETDNRDIFNPITGLFAATTVTKGQQSDFTYRVRAGTPNAGFPGTAQGWMPLAVVSVPTGSTTVDTMTFWDVRPLISDRTFAPFNISRSFPRRGLAIGKARFDTVSLHTIASGFFEAEIAGRRVGGLLRPGAPVMDATSINLDQSEAPGQTPAASSFWFLYLVTPFGLPRWARYTDGPANRAPRSPRGIPIVSNVPPLADGTPSAAVALPTNTGLGGTSSSAVLVLAGGTDGSGTLIGCESDGRLVTLGSNAQRTINASSLTNGIVTWSMTENTHYPANAKAIHALLTLTDSLGGVGANAGVIYGVSGLSIYDSADLLHAVASLQLGQFAFPNFGGTAATGSFEVAVRIPIVHDFPTTTPGSRQVELGYSGGTGTPQSATLKVFGWEF